jgi:hypothetical protein
LTWISQSQSQSISNQNSMSHGSSACTTRKLYRFGALVPMSNLRSSSLDYMLVKEGGEGGHIVGAGTSQKTHAWPPQLLEYLDHVVFQSAKLVLVLVRIYSGSFALASLLLKKNIWRPICKSQNTRKIPNRKFSTSHTPGAG